MTGRRMITSMLIVILLGTIQAAPSTNGGSNRKRSADEWDYGDYEETTEAFGGGSKFSLMTNATAFRWPNNTLYFEFDDDVRSAFPHIIYYIVKEGYKQLNATLGDCIDIQKGKGNNEQYLHIGFEYEHGVGCSSSLGYDANVYPSMHLMSRCTIGDAMHLFMRVLGFVHEDGDQDIHIDGLSECDLDKVQVHYGCKSEITKCTAPSTTITSSPDYEWLSTVSHY